MQEDPDPNRAAVRRARLDEAHTAWLDQVADLVPSRLDAVRVDWRELAEREALEAAVFGLLLGSLARDYPGVLPMLSRVAEEHPSFGTWPQGSRLATLQHLVETPTLIAEWVGPLLDVHDPERLRVLSSTGS